MAQSQLRLAQLAPLSIDWPTLSSAQQEAPLLHSEVVERDVYFRRLVGRLRQPPHTAVVVDVGANVGLFTLRALLGQPPPLAAHGVHVVAVEPIAATVACLVANVNRGEQALARLHRAPPPQPLYPRTELWGQGPVAVRRGASATVVLAACGAAAAAAARVVYDPDVPGEATLYPQRRAARRRHTLALAKYWHALLRREQLLRVLRVQWPPAAEGAAPEPLLLEDRQPETEIKPQEGRKDEAKREIVRDAEEEEDGEASRPPAKRRKEEGQAPAEEEVADTRQQRRRCRRMGRRRTHRRGAPPRIAGGEEEDVVQAEVVDFLRRHPTVDLDNLLEVMQHGISQLEDAERREVLRLSRQGQVDQDMLAEFSLGLGGDARSDGTAALTSPPLVTATTAAVAAGPAPPMDVDTEDAASTSLPHMETEEERTHSSKAEVGLVSNRALADDDTVNDDGDLEDDEDENAVPEVVEVPLVTLAQIIRHLRLTKIDILKIDCEGAEMDVLLGLTDANWAMVDQVVAEVEGAATLAAMTRLLVTHGFECRTEKQRVSIDPNGFFSFTPATLDLHYLWANRPEICL